MATKKTKTAAEWIETIQDETVKRYLKENHEKHENPLTDAKVKDRYVSMVQLLLWDFEWSTTPQGTDFWLHITEHFEKGEGLKTYEDFKHLDNSIPRTN